MTRPSETTIACDESGHEGDRVFESANPIFTHAAVAIGSERAQEIVDHLRKRLKAQSSELKAKQVPRSSATIDWLLTGQEDVVKGSSVWVLDKNFYVSSRIVDLLLEEVPHEDGVDLYTNFDARQIAYDFHRLGPRSFPPGEWDRLRRTFNSLARVKDRTGSKASVDDLFVILEALRWQCRRRQMEPILDVLLRARKHADSIAQGIPAMDPLFAGIHASAREWHDRFGLPVRMVHDSQSSLTPDRIAMMLDIARNPYPIPGVKCFDFVDIELADSRSDPRIQLADIVGGIVRAYSSHILFPVVQACAIEPAPQIRSMILDSSAIASQGEWPRLTGRQHTFVLPRIVF